MAKKSKIDNRYLTERLKELASEVYDCGDVNADGEVVYILNADRLAALIWRDALGWEEQILMDDGEGGVAVAETVYHAPIRRAQEFIFDRIEGKALPAQFEQGGKHTVADKVGALNAARINDLAAKRADSVPPPPTRKKKTDDD